jgi:hypothetical protein
MNTVMLNEALVLHYAALGRKVYGINPGLIPSGIRNPAHGGGALGCCLEACIGCLNPSPAAYAARLLPALLSSDLDAHPGAMLGQGAGPILPTPELTPEVVAQWVAKGEALAAKAMQEGAGSPKL